MTLNEQIWYSSTNFSGQSHLYWINLLFSSDLSFLLAGTPCLSRWPGATLCSFYNLLGLWIFDQEGTFFSFHTHSVHRWGRFWPLLAPLAKSHKEFAGTTADQLLIFVLKIAPGKTDQAWVAIRELYFWITFQEEQSLKVFCSCHVSKCILIWI